MLGLLAGLGWLQSAGFTRLGRWQTWLISLLALGRASIYPAVFFHGLLNLAGYLNLTSNAVEGTSSSWLLLTILMLPLAIFGLFIVRGLRQRSMVFDTA